MKKLMFLIVFVMVLFSLACFMLSVSIAADAVPAAQGTTLGAAVKDVVEGAVLPLIVSLVGILVSIVLVKLKNKFNIQLSAETEAWINKQAENAVQLVAEKAAAKIKYENIKLSGNEKLDMAIASLITKVPKITREQADSYIHAALARIPGIGATGEASLVAKT